MKKKRVYLGFWGDPNGLLNSIRIHNPRVRLLIQFLGYALLACIAGTLVYAVVTWCQSGFQVPR